MSLDENQIQNLRKGVLRSGFALEWQTSEIFLKYKFNVKQNLLLPKPEFQRIDVQNQVEIDVLATFPVRRQQREDVYLVECKGTSSENVLVLVESSNYLKSFSSITFKNKEIHFSSRENFLANPGSGPFLCYSGDFFHKKTETWEKIGKQDDRSNFYKAAQQVVSGIDAFFNRDTGDEEGTDTGGTKIFPLIVTNAELFIARFQKEDRSIDINEPVLVSKPWALYENPLAYGGNSLAGNLLWHSDDPSEDRALQGDKRIPYIWVVQVNYLEKFINLKGRSYAGLKKQTESIKVAKK